MHVMKHQLFPGKFPVYAEENTYKEAEIKVHNGICTVVHDETVSVLYSRGYDKIGEIERPEDLPRFLAELEKPKSDEEKKDEKTFTKVIDPKPLSDGIPVASEVQTQAPQYWWEQDGQK